MNLNTSRTKVVYLLRSKEVIFAHQKDIVCIEHPATATDMEFLKSIFPNAKFINVVRDGRAVANALINSIDQMDITNGNPPFLKFNRYEHAMRYGVFFNQGFLPEPKSQHLKIIF